MRHRWWWWQKIPKQRAGTKAVREETDMQKDSQIDRQTETQEEIQVTVGRNK